jgi:hypothetical protein
LQQFNTNKKIAGKESEKRIAEIEAEMHLAREHSLADAMFH